MVSLDEEHPVFSVCIDATHRASTIINTLDGIRNQSFTHFEVIVNDAGDLLDCWNVIHEWNQTYNDSRFRFFRLSSPDASEVQNWNLPIKLARGDYIAVCEGDDVYRSDHLEIAQMALNSFPHAKLFVARGTSDIQSFTTPCSKNEIEPKFTVHENTKIGLVRFQWCPAPSLTVFPRLDSSLEPFLYDEEAVWAGEYGLYWKLLENPGSQVIESSETTVYRRPSPKVRNSTHLVDAREFYEKTKNQLDRTDRIYAITYLSTTGLQYFMWNKKLGKIDFRALRIGLRYLRWSSLLGIIRRRVKLRGSRRKPI
jgi:glycosyltransferase involved in cell wall biosynthesis